MKHSLTLLLALSFLWGHTISQTYEFDYKLTVVLEADVQAFPPQITLNWVEDDSATAYVIYRKTAPWEWSPITSVGGSTLTFTDTNVVVGETYEYRVQKQALNFTGDGYILAGIEAEPIEQRGTAILVVEDTYSDNLQPEINRYISDMEMDGWVVKSLYVNRNDDVMEVKTFIQQIYEEDPVNTQAVILLGHVPVPYSGYINLDGHPEHTGAMPADTYYAEFDGQWTDQFVTSLEAPVGSRNRNVPGDGKFDQSYIPSDLDCQVGRIDFAGLATIPLSEEELLRSYLDKNHNYRHRKFFARERGLIDNRLGFIDEGFGQNGLKNFVPMFGLDSVEYDTFTKMVGGNSYLMSYVASFGANDRLINVADIQDFQDDDYETVFTMMMGSYFGDWDTLNNLMRVSLAEGMTLTNAWVGRPDWNLHHMAMGYNIGHSELLTQNDSTFYDPSIYEGLGRIVSISMLGDPTLRAHTMTPPSNLTAESSGQDVKVMWNPSPHPGVLGYHLYKRTSETEPFVRVNNSLIQYTSFMDYCATSEGTKEYMVRAVELKETGSGSYHNLSQGVRAIMNYTNEFSVLADFNQYTLEAGSFFKNGSSNALDFLWDFGDGKISTEKNPVHTYEKDGIYKVKLIASNTCGMSTKTKMVHFVAPKKAVPEHVGLSIFPNPFRDVIHVQVEGVESPDLVIRLFDSSGRMVQVWDLSQPGLRKFFELPASNLPNGTYFLEVDMGMNGILRKQVVRMR